MNDDQRYDDADKFLSLTGKGLKYFAEIIIYLIVILCAEVFQPLNTILDAYEKLGQSKQVETERITVGPHGEQMTIGF